MGMFISLSNWQVIKYLEQILMLGGYLTNKWASYLISKSININEDIVELSVK